MQVNRVFLGGPTVDSSARTLRHVTARRMREVGRHTAGLASSGFVLPDGKRNAMRCGAVEMKQRVWAVGVLLALGACAGVERSAAFRSTETQLFAARQAAALQCSTPAECDRAWRLARRYVEGRSSTRITRADADTIETAPPFLAGEVYVWASRTASGGGDLRCASGCALAASGGTAVIRSSPGRRAGGVMPLHRVSNRPAAVDPHQAPVTAPCARGAWRLALDRDAREHDRAGRRACLR